MCSLSRRYFMFSSIRKVSTTAILTAVVAAGFAHVAVPARAGYMDNIWTAGHGDIGGLGYDDGELVLHYHFGPGTTVNGAPLPGGRPDEFYEFAPTDLTTRVSDLA